MKLHGYFRSTASWRVRIALRLKAIDHRQTSLHLRRGDQEAPAYRRLNPQALVPAVELDDGTVLTQSLAICEYLDELWPEPPLLPADAVLRARVRAFAQVIACDIHPVQNLKILERLRRFGLSDDQVTAWASTTITEGLDACADLLEREAPSPFCFGEGPTLADICLVPQLTNARRFGVNLRWPRLLAIEERCNALQPFQQARPEVQPDAE